MKKQSKKTTKSQAIRDYVSKHPNATVSETVAGMQEQGVTVSKQSVSAIKIKLAAEPTKAVASGKTDAVPGKRKYRKRKKRAPKQASQATVTLETLVQAKRLAEQLGGVEKAKKALDALASLQ